eukprot:c12609_g1_i1 orf=145-534(+)
MDWGVPSEMIEVLESSANDLHIQQQEEEERREEEEEGELSAAHSCQEEARSFNAVDDLLAAICDAGEKLFVSVFSWAPWRIDQLNLPPSPECPLQLHQAGREIQLIERPSAPGDFCKRPSVPGDFCNVL